METEADTGGMRPPARGRLEPPELEEVGRPLPGASGGSAAPGPPQDPSCSCVPASISPPQTRAHLGWPGGAAGCPRAGDTALTSSPRCHSSWGRAGPGGCPPTSPARPRASWWGLGGAEELRRDGRSCPVKPGAPPTLFSPHWAAALREKKSHFFQGWLGG